jgi:hypothetical protein
VPAFPDHALAITGNLNVVLLLQRRASLSGK